MACIATALHVLIACMPLVSASSSSLVIGISASPGFAMLKLPAGNESAVALDALMTNEYTPEWSGSQIAEWDLTGFMPDMIPKYTAAMGYSPR